MIILASLIALAVGASDVKPVDANAFVAELNGLLIKYRLPTNNLILGPQPPSDDLSSPLKPKDNNPLMSNIITSSGSSNLTTSTADSINIITKEEFDKAFTGSGFPTQPSQYQGFLNSLKIAQISNKREAAMYLVHLIQQSGGLKFRAESFCSDPANAPRCATDYPPAGGVGQPGKSYYARSFLMMRGAVNYFLASQYLYQNDDLVKNPDKAATDDATSWDVSGWLWRTYVHRMPGIEKGLFGVSTFALTQGKGCLPDDAAANANRRKYYEAIFAAFNLPGSPQSVTGC